MASADLLKALELIEDTKNTNVSDWTNSILSTLYTQAIDGTAKTVCHRSVKCKQPKQTMIATLPELGTFLKPTPVEAIPKCTPSHFGRGDELVYDESVRKSVEHKLQKIDDLHATIRDAAAFTAVQLFGSLVKLTADKVVIYSPGGKFDKHRDSIASADHIGTVVIQLPVECEGGELLFNNASVIERKKRQVCYYDNSNSGGSSSDSFFDSDDESNGRRRWSSHTKYPKLNATAFYTDVEHNVTPVTSGHRVTVTFKVEKSGNEPICLTSWDIKNERVPSPTCVSACNLGYNLEIERGWGNRDGVDSDDDEDLPLQPFIDSLQSFNNRPIVIGCRHMIPRAALNIEGLRGVDKTVAQKLVAAGYSVTPVLVTVDKIDGMEDSYANYNHIFVCDLPKDSSPIFVRPTDDYEALILESGKRHVQHIGNEPGEVEALRYISAALLVVKA